MSHFVVYVITEKKDIDAAFNAIRQFEFDEDEETQFQFPPISNEQVASDMKNYRTCDCAKDHSFEVNLELFNIEMDDVTKQYGIRRNVSEFDYCTIGGRFSGLIPDNVCRCDDLKKYMDKFIAYAIVLPDGNWIDKENFDKDQYGDWEKYLLQIIASFSDHWIWLFDAHN